MNAAAIGVFWAVAAWGVAGRGGQRLIGLYLAALPFMSFAVLPVEATGGLTLTPAPVLALLIAGRTLMVRRGAEAVLSDALRPGRMLLLTLFWAVAVVVTLFMPRILGGRVLVVPVRATWLGPVPLWPSAQNLTQLGYLTVSVMLAVALAGLLRDEGRRRRALAGLCLGGGVAVATGLLDFASFYLPPVGAVLEPFRTASYALLVSDHVLGGKRVVGLMPEASSYGLLCLGFLSLLCFFRREIPGERRRRWVVPPLLALLVVCIWLSTSSAAYVGLGVLGVALGLDWGWRAAALPRGAAGRRGLAAAAWLAGGAVAAGLLMVVLAPGVVEAAVARVELMVVRKPESSSFAERQVWNATSWQALIGSAGLGVGVGSSRASSSIVAVASSTGVLGAGLYLAFVLQTLRRRARAGDAEGAVLLGALRWALLPPLAVDLMIGTSADFGPFLALLFGLSAAVAHAPEREARGADARGLPAPAGV